DSVRGSNPCRNRPDGCVIVSGSPDERSCCDLIDGHFVAYAFCKSTGSSNDRTAGQYQPGGRNDRNSFLGMAVGADRSTASGPVNGVCKNRSGFSPVVEQNREPVGGTTASRSTVVAGQSTADDRTSLSRTNKRKRLGKHVMCSFMFLESALAVFYAPAGFAWTSYVENPIMFVG